MNDEEYYTKSNTTKPPVKPKINKQHRQVWQGREDEDMLREKQSNWHCHPNSSDDFGDEE